MVSAPPDARTWGDGFARRRVGKAVGDTLAIVLAALRLVVRHWPVLLAFALAGAAARQLAIRLAVWASALSGEFGMLVLVLAPLATLAAWVLMLRALQPSLSDPAPGGGRPSVLNYIGSALLPFLAVYETYGYLTADISDYVYRVFEAEVLRNPDVFASPDAVDLASRMPFELDATKVAVVLVAIALRWLLSRWRATETHAWLGIPGAYLETLWITMAVGATYRAVSDAVTDWVTSRKVVHWAQDLWHDLVDRLGWLTAPVRAVTGWFGEQMGNWQELLGVPLAWLAIAAVVLGYGEVKPTRVTPGAAVVPGNARRAWRVVPTWLRRLLWHLVGVRFAPLLRTLRTLATIGLRPALLFCLAFAIAGTVPAWLWELERWLVGPHDLAAVWITLAWPLSTLNESVGMVLLICLVAAAADRTFRRPAATDQSGPQAGTSQA